MALSIPQIVHQFKADVAKVLTADTIRKICRDVGYSWRERVLDPVTTIHVFLVQILHGNTACTALSRLAGVAFSAAAYCEARKRVPLAVFQELLRRVCDALYPEVQTTGRWRGHRTWTMDGSSFSMPDTPALQARFGQPSNQAKGCGFPVAHMLVLFHAGTGLLLRVLASPLRTHDMRHAATMHAELEEGDVLLADRGFASFAHLALLFMRKMYGVFRCHQRQIVSFRKGRKHTGRSRPNKGRPRSRYVKRLGRRDQVVEYTKPKNRPKWMDDATYATLPETVLVRELRFFTPQRGYRTTVITLVTTLLDPVAYPAVELAKLYLSRWQVEVNFRHLKTTMGMEVLHCKTEDGVLKEMYMFALAYNLIRLVMLKAARCQKVPLDRISFIDALRWLRDAKADTILTPLVVNQGDCTTIPKENRYSRIPRSTFRRYWSLQPAHFRLQSMPALQVVSLCNRDAVNRRIKPRFSCPCPLCRRLSSSRKLTSKTQCKDVSMPQ
jgi:Transposase DDE domain